MRARILLLLGIGLLATGCENSPISYYYQLPRDAGPDRNTRAFISPDRGPCPCPEGCGEDMSVDAILANARSFATLNASLDEAPYAAQRRPLIAKALRMLGTDVVCLQGVWNDEDVAALKQGLGEVYPYTLTQKSEDSVPPQGLAHGGRNGLLLLSRKPLTEPSYAPLDGTLVSRGVLRARVGDIMVLCTQLPASTSTVPYPKGRPYKSWSEEQAALAAALDRLAPSTCTAVLGDMNAGPGGSALTAEQPQVLQQFMKAGFGEGWAAPACTHCRDNGLGNASADRWLDHIFFRSCFGKPTYERVLDGPVTLMSGQGIVEGYLSDRYGLRAERQ